MTGLEQTATGPEVKVDLNAGRYIVAGLLIVVVLFGGVGSWAALAPVSGAVIAPGVVTVESNRKTVQHLEGGIIDKILVRDGDIVAAGDLLIRLDGTRAKAKLAILDGKLDALRAREGRLTAERSGGARVAFTSDLETRRADDRKLAEILAAEEALFRARRASLEGQIEVLKQRAAKFEDEIRGLQAQEQSKVRQIELIEEELAGLRDLYEKGYTPRTRILALERTAEQLKGERGAHVAEIARAENGIAESNLQILQLEKAFREEVVEELRDVQAEIFDLTEERTTARDELERVEIRAPQAGTVVGLRVHTAGGVISPGQPLLDLVPGADELVLETQVRPADIDKIRPGQEARIRFTAFNQRTTPEVTGAVDVASADRLTDEATGTSYYRVRVRIPDGELARLGSLELIPGMPAEVFISTGERTALSYLLKPFADATARAFKEG